MDETLAELMADDDIKESDSPWASPVVLVCQRGKDRFCIDYRKIDNILRADRYPIPRVMTSWVSFQAIIFHYL